MGGRHTDRRRKPSSRKPKRIMGLVTEGVVTEPEYVRILQARYRVPTGMVRLVKSNKTNPLGLVEVAERARSENVRNAKRGREPLVDEWWVMFDVEGPLHPHARISEAVAKARSLGIGVALSNPSFEYWLLLHYCYTTRPYATADEVIGDLRKYMPSYHPGHKYPEAKGLGERIDVALRHAERARTWREGAAANLPMTDVDLFVGAVIAANG